MRYKSKVITIKNLYLIVQNQNRGIHGEMIYTIVKIALSLLQEQIIQEKYRNLMKIN